MTEEKKSEIIESESPLAVQETEEKKTGLMRGAKDFFENTFATLKGKDLNQAVEEFSGEMTLVVEGMSEDLASLRQYADKTSAQLTITEEKMLRRDETRKGEIDELRDMQKQLIKRLDAADKRMADMDKAIKEAEKKPKKMGLGAILRQATWIAAIVCGAWVIVTLLKLIGK